MVRGAFPYAPFKLKALLCENHTQVMLCLTGNCGVQSSVLALPTLSRTLWTPAQRVVQLPVDCGQCQKVWWHITSCQSLTTQTCVSLKNAFCSNKYISCPFDFPACVALFDTFGAQYAVLSMLSEYCSQICLNSRMAPPRPTGSIREADVRQSRLFGAVNGQTEFTHCYCSRWCRTECQTRQLQATRSHHPAIYYFWLNFEVKVHGEVCNCSHICLIWPHINI